MKRDEEFFQNQN